ncbi:MAG: ABC transporter ATP-binding protein/permease [Defluviitaleaceae bacterium]|nr:ABC transporter ATP-binding protein/permease [Defluviitaleaceae bacterium]
MIKLLHRYGKPFLPLFFIAVVLLIARAAGELALPNLMSNIVDVGIAQGGIDYTVPTRLTPEGYADLREILPADVYDELVWWLEIRDTSIDFEITEGSYELITQAVARLQFGSADFDPRDTNQLAIEFIRSEYERLGVDMDAHQMNFVLTTGGIMILIALGSITVAILQGLCSARIATGLSRKLRSEIFSKVTGFNNSEYNQFSTASLITRSTNDVQQVQALMAIAIRIVIYSPIMAAGGILMVLGTDASMAWAIALAVGAIIAFITLFIIIATPKFKIMQKLIDKVNLVTREGLTGMMVIRAFNTQKHEAKRFDGVNSKLRKTALFLARLGALQMPTITLIMGFTNILIIWFGGISINEGYLQVGDMMAFITYTMFVVWSFIMLAFVVMMLPRASVAAQRILEVVNTKNEILDPIEPKEMPKKGGFVQFKNVSFKFPSAVGNALEGISFIAEQGKMTAIVGSTGAGKTALANLVPRFYDVTSGEVLVNGINVKDVTQEDLRSIIGYVPQKALLFSGTIESNIKYAGNVDDASMEKAARIAQAEDFIEEKTDKFGEEISQGGANVSGGQRQRLAIARAIAKNPNIYIFDDSFSALDYKTDANLRAAIADEIGNATMIVVAQRINTIKNADQIIVLDEGKIVGVGQHRDLLKTCDVYKQIASSQLSVKEMERYLGE